MAADAARKLLLSKVRAIGSATKDNLVDAIMYTMDEGYADEIVDALADEDVGPCDDCDRFLCECDDDEDKEVSDGEETPSEEGSSTTPGGEDRPAPEAGDAVGG